MRRAAEIAFAAIFAIAPLMIILVAIVGVAFVLLVSVAANAALSFAQAHYLAAVSGLVTQTLVPALFAALFKVLPDVTR